ncbi:MAG TPA: GntR family transcriptional regulator [Streptosporangiaceae bacterium]
MADPMYRLIAEELRGQIESGDLGPGAQLPTEFELRDRFSASRNTVRDAIKSLIALGLVVTRPGQGTFVTDRIDPFVTTLSADPSTGMGGGEGATYLSQVSQAHRKPSMSEPRVEIQQASGEIGARLRVENGTQLISRHEKRFIDDQPWSLQTSFYPMDFVLKGATRLLEATNIEEGTVRYLQEKLGLKQVGYRDWITVRAPDANELSFFRIPGDGRVPVFEVFRTAFDQSENPMRLTVSTFPVDRSQFIVDVGKVPAPQLGPDE